MAVAGAPIVQEDHAHRAAQACARAALSVLRRKIHLRTLGSPNRNDRFVTRALADFRDEPGGNVVSLQLRRRRSDKVIDGPAALQISAAAVHARNQGAHGLDFQPVELRQPQA